MVALSVLVLSPDDKEESTGSERALLLLPVDSQTVPDCSLHHASHAGRSSNMSVARYQPALVALALFACAAALWVPQWREGLGIELNASFIRALIHVELALPVLLLIQPLPQRRFDCALALINACACFCCTSAALLTMAFISSPELILRTRLLGASSWLAAGGLQLLGAALDTRLDGFWRSRIRVGWIALTGLPVLWHYFALEYSQKSLLHLRPLSPNWLLAASPDAGVGVIECWPLLLIGGVGGFASLLILGRKSEPKAAPAPGATP